MIYCHLFDLENNFSISDGLQHLAKLFSYHSSKSRPKLQ